MGKKCVRIARDRPKAAPPPPSTHWHNSSLMGPNVRAPGSGTACIAVLYSVTVWREIQIRNGQFKRYIPALSESETICFNRGNRHTQSTLSTTLYPMRGTLQTPCGRWWRGGGERLLFLAGWGSESSLSVPMLIISVIISCCRHN